MRNKKLITLAASLVTLLAVSGCSLNREVESLRPYAPSDGVQADVDSLKSRNLMFIRNEAGQAVLIGSFFNGSQNDLMGSVQTLDANGEEIRFEFTVEPGGKYDLGYNGNPGLVLEISEPAGAMHSVFLSGGEDPFGVLVPVMDGTLAEYQPFVDQLN